ncbi:hypothetical protein [Asticcacaulis machinosus]|uniref:Uncharacterized protein n=1 Tax=Asticcacaulis machinosus TaxID=2984211 RepID=A0ABT5HIV9_9CAUL|nr:hypothetical protein [Asticcacaulis machinosus]MDC7676175.1 hypothetical protein [Asticcacaulis machinosus]
MIWLETLRAATRDTHDGLHHHPLLAPLSTQGLTRERLGIILQGFEVYYRASEAAISISPPADLPHAPVRDWLAQDMVALKLAPLECR